MMCWFVLALTGISEHVVCMSWHEQGNVLTAVDQQQQAFVYDVRAQHTPINVGCLLLCIF